MQFVTFSYQPKSCVRGDVLPWRDAWDVYLIKPAFRLHPEGCVNHSFTSVVYIDYHPISDPPPPQHRTTWVYLHRLLQPYSARSTPHSESTLRTPRTLSLSRSSWKSASFPLAAMTLGSRIRTDRWWWDVRGKRSHLRIVRVCIVLSSPNGFMYALWYAIELMRYHWISVITDPNGQFLFGIRNKLIAIHKTFIGEDAHGNEIFRIKKKLSFGSHLVATFHNPATNSPTTLVLKGDFWGGSADISIEGGPVVGQISRKLFNAREFWGDKQTVRPFPSLIIICMRGQWLIGHCRLVLFDSSPRRGPCAHGSGLYMLRWGEEWGK